MILENGIQTRVTGRIRSKINGHARLEEKSGHPREITFGMALRLRTAVNGEAEGRRLVRRISSIHRMTML